eukprot:1115558-Lingulodinium_polyedra.AAC.1
MIAGHQQTQERTAFLTIPGLSIRKTREIIPASISAFLGCVAMARTEDCRLTLSAIGCQIAAPAFVIDKVNTCNSAYVLSQPEVQPLYAWHLATTL